MVEGYATVCLSRKVRQHLRFIHCTSGIAQDNTKTIKWAEEGLAKHFLRRKHMDMKLSHIMKLIAAGEALLSMVDTIKMTSDYLNNTLPCKPLLLQSDMPNYFSFVHLNTRFEPEKWYWWWSNVQNIWQTTIKLTMSVLLRVTTSVHHWLNKFESGSDSLNLK